MPSTRASRAADRPQPAAGARQRDGEDRRRSRAGHRPEQGGACLPAERHGRGRKIGFYFAKLWEFLSDEPREANTEGGIFPAIFGTVMMTLIMAVIVTPFGVLAAIYLRASMPSRA